MSKKTEDLINQLTGDMGTAVRKAPKPMLSTLLVAAVSAVYVVLMFSVVYSFRSDIGTLIKNPFFIAEVTLAAALGLAGILVSFFSAIPGRINNMTPIHLAFFASILGLIALFRMSVEAVSNYTMMDLIESCDCIIHIGAFSLPALVLTFLKLKQLAPTNLRLTSAYAAASSAFIGYAFLRLHCPDIASQHYMVIHLGAVGLYGLVAYLLGRKILNW